MDGDQAKTIKKLQIELILLSLALLGGAMVWTWQIGMTANGLDHELFHATEHVQELRQAVQKMEARHA